MEHGDLKFRIVMDDGKDTLVLARVADLELGAAAFMAAKVKFSNRNLYLKDGARVVQQHEGEPKPELAPPDPNLKSWSVSMIGGKKMEHHGFVQAKDEAAAIDAAMKKFSFSPAQRKRLTVNLAGG